MSPVTTADVLTGDGLCYQHDRRRLSILIPRVDLRKVTRTARCGTSDVLPTSAPARSS